VQVSAGAPGEPPICKIVDKKVLREQEQVARKPVKSKAPSATIKQLELNWAIDPNDLNHRLNKMVEFLRKGWRVEVLLAPKKRGRRASPEEAEELLDKIREKAREVPGAKEIKALEGKIGATVSLNFEGKLQKEAATE
jgi:translation initiation factor IF-3